MSFQPLYKVMVQKLGFLAVVLYLDPPKAFEKMADSKSEKLKITF